MERVSSRSHQAARSPEGDGVSGDVAVDNSVISNCESGDSVNGTTCECLSGDLQSIVDSEYATKVTTGTDSTNGQTTDTQACDPSPASAPQYAAKGEVRGALVYFSSVSENTARFVVGCCLDELGINVYRIPLRPKEAPLKVREPYVLMVPTYGGGNVAKAVPVQVKKFLNDPDNRSYIKGVIASGNTNFGEAFAAAGDVIAAKCGVPFLYYFELMGTTGDVTKVQQGLVEFFHNLRVDVNK